ncbi:DegT/DnrJ/EryC1/StrS family aminotransferase [Streptomyces sp. NPDC002690]
MTTTPSPLRAPEGAGRGARPFLHGTEYDAVAKVLASGHWAHGPESESFERELASYLGVPDVVTVASGTVALSIALIAAGVGPGDEVVVPSLTFCASVQAILAAGAFPRFAEVDPDTLCVTPETVRQALTSRTRAVMPVLYGGRPVDLTPLHPVLDAQGIHVVEDAAHAFGSEANGRMVGAGAQAITCFSFDPLKNLTCGDGGALVPRTAQEAEAARTLRALGIKATYQQRAQTTGYEVAGFGLRAHLPSINAAIGRAQLHGFAEVVRRRRELWAAYGAAVADVPGVRVLHQDIEAIVPFNFVVLVPERDRVFHALREQGVGVGVNYPANHVQPAFSRWHRDLPVTEDVAGRILSLPFHPEMHKGDVAFTAAALTDAVRGARGPR